MKDKVSELMDGELEAGAARRAIDLLESDAEALETWRRYHLIGDAMRHTPLLSPGFAARPGEKLAGEPTVFAPGRPRLEPRRWQAIPTAVAASVAAFALVGWLAFAPQAPQTAPAPMAQVQPATAPKPQSVPLPSGTPDYLLA